MNAPPNDRLSFHLGSLTGIFVGIQLMIAKAARKLRSAGLRKTIKESFNYITQKNTPDAFDLKYGSDTSGSIPLWNLNISSPNAKFGVKYQAAEEHDVIDALKFIHDDLSQFVYIDIGCGKGRTLLIAAKFGFKQIIGMDFSDELVKIAKKNITSMQISNADVIQADAASYRFPDENMVIFLYNPFGLEVMQKLVANLEVVASRKIYILYMAPSCATVLDASGFLTNLGCLPTSVPVNVWTATTRGDDMPCPPGAQAA